MSRRLQSKYFKSLSLLEVWVRSQRRMLIMITVMDISFDKEKEEYLLKYEDRSDLLLERKIVKYWCKNGHTKSFRSGGVTSTLLGWTPEYNSEGKQINVDPNCHTEHYICNECGQEYTKIRRGWIIRFYIGKHSCWVSHEGGDDYKEPDFLIDDTPNYLKKEK